MSDKTKINIHHAEAAFAILEQAFALSALLLLVVAAFDINKFLQAYQALQIGVNTSLRKCYVTDGGCTSPKEQEHAQLSKIWQKPIKGFEQDYMANGLYLELPNLRFNNPSARILDSSQSHYRQMKADFYLLKYTVAGDIYYGEQNTELPYLDNFDFRQANELRGEHLRQLDIARNCQIKGPNGQASTSLSDIGASTSNSRGIRIGSLTCRVPSPFNSSNASWKALIESCNTNFANFATCERNWKAGTRIALDVQGESHSAGPSGKVGLSITQNGNNNLKGDRQDTDCKSATCTLGGRVFSGTGTFNFVPRGLPIGHLSSNLTCPNCPYAEEFQNHQYIWVNYDRNFELSFELKRLDGHNNENVNWNLTDLRIYYIDYKPNKNEILCLEKARKSSLASGKLSCSYLFPEKPTAENLKVYNLRALDTNPSERIQSAPSRCLDPKLPTHDGYGNSISNTELRRNELKREQSLAFCASIGETKNCLSDYEITIEQSYHGCGTYTDSPNECPFNYGIYPSSQEQWDQKRGQFFIIDSSEALSICPPFRSKELDPDIPAISTTWYEDELQLPAIPKKYEAVDCHEIANLQSLEIPPPYDQYKNFIPGPASIDGKTRIGLGQQVDPRIVKEQDDRYSCKEVSLGRDSFKISNERDLGCKWNDKNNSALLELMLSKAGFPQSYYLEPLDKTRSAKQIGEYFYKTPYELDACTDYEVSDDPKYFDERIYLGLFASGSYPPSCTPMDPKHPEHSRTTKPSDWCLSQVTGNIAQGGGGLEAINSASTRATALEAIRRFFPAARTSCEAGSPYCVDLKTPSPEIVDGKTVFEASAKMTIPMNLLFGRDIPIEISDRRTWEGEFAR
ncbi:MAG: hypothetical protein GYA55_08815 [SAR324 cluster bacterium]|uniref:Uncharacterized protein n=1 Tax=SAR324 cluster bacterium TaxID=2024889 RepID=A0A7X9FST7_9DELT|nr:hypothetical protein [SAR324 cluster bacterium]